MTVTELQSQVARLYEQRGYSSDLKTLALGLCEEAGEVAAAVLNMSPDFRPKPERAKDDLAQEIRDCLVYLCALANAVSLSLDPGPTAEEYMAAIEGLVSLRNGQPTAESIAAEICRGLSENIVIGGTDYRTVLAGIERAIARGQDERAAHSRLLSLAEEVAQALENIVKAQVLTSGYQMAARLLAEKARSTIREAG